jgi:hypothetical protein
MEVIEATQQQLALQVGLEHPLALQLVHPLALQLAHPLVLQLAHPLVLQPEHPLALQLAHPLALQPAHPLVLMDQHVLAHSHPTALLQEVVHHARPLSLHTTATDLRVVVTMEVQEEAEATAVVPQEEEEEDMVVDPAEEEEEAVVAVAVAEEDNNLMKIRNARLFDGQIRSTHLSYANVSTVSFFKQDHIVSAIDQRLDRVH